MHHCQSLLLQINTEKPVKRQHQRHALLKVTKTQTTTYKQLKRQYRANKAISISTNNADKSDRAKPKTSVSQKDTISFDNNSDKLSYCRRTAPRSMSLLKSCQLLHSCMRSHILRGLY